MKYFIHTLATLTATGLLVSLSAHAAMKEIGILITGGATYQITSQNDLDYLTTFTENAVRTHHMDPEYTWGYYLGAGYKINEHYDVQGSWAQYDANNEVDATVIGEVGGVTGYSTSSSDSLPLSLGNTLKGQSHETLNSQILEVNVGQTHVLSDAMDARFFAGVRYADIASETTNLYEEPSFITTPYDHYRSDFKGVGPEIGMDLQYKVVDAPYDPFSIVGSVTMAFLIGEQESEANIFNATQTKVNNDSVVRMIPNMNAKLGLKWGLIEGGYQVNYFHQVVEQLDNYSNVGIMGFYFNMSAKL